MSRSLTLSKFDFQGKPHVFYDDHLDLLARDEHPDPAFYAEQRLPTEGLGYITTRDGTTLSVTVTEPEVHSPPPTAAGASARLSTSAVRTSSTILAYWLSLAGAVAAYLAGGFSRTARDAGRSGARALRSVPPPAFAASP